jgi:hypothetical protein
VDLYFDNEHSCLVFADINGIVSIPGIPNNSFTTFDHRARPPAMDSQQAMTIIRFQSQPTSEHQLFAQLYQLLTIDFPPINQEIFMDDQNDKPANQLSPVSPNQYPALQATIFFCSGIRPSMKMLIFIPISFCLEASAVLPFHPASLCAETLDAAFIMSRRSAEL